MSGIVEMTGIGIGGDIVSNQYDTDNEKELGKLRFWLEELIDGRGIQKIIIERFDVVEMGRYPTFEEMEGVPGLTGEIIEPGADMPPM